MIYDNTIEEIPQYKYSTWLFKNNARDLISQFTWFFLKRLHFKH